MRLAGAGRPLAGWILGHRVERLPHCRVDMVRYHDETGQGWSAQCYSDGFCRTGETSPNSDQFIPEIDFWNMKGVSGRAES